MRRVPHYKLTIELLHKICNNLTATLGFSEGWRETLERILSLSWFLKIHFSDTDITQMKDIKTKQLKTTSVYVMIKYINEDK